MKKWGFLMFLLIGLIACAKPAPTPEDRVKYLGSRIRCPICRGVPIADSPSALAAEMMEVVRQQVEAGKSDDEILRFFEDRYGEWVLLEPKPEGLNLAIWILPGLVLVGGGIGIAVRLKKQRT